MAKAQLLKIVNPIIAVLVIIQAFSAVCLEFLGDVIPYGPVSAIHTCAGFLFIAFIVCHVALNWSWILANFFKKKK